MKYKIVTYSVMFIVALAVVARLSAESKQTSGTTLSRLVFAPGVDATELTKVRGWTDKVWGSVTVRGRASAGPFIVNGSGSSSQAVIPLGSTTGLSSNDNVVVAGLTNLPYYGTIVTVTASNVTLSANLTSGVESNDAVYKVVPIFYARFASTGGTNLVDLIGAPIAKTIQKSPIVVELDGTSTNELSATVK